jgi:hypothetical protein
LQVLESKIETKVCERVLQDFGVRSIKLNVHGNTGIPDRLFLIPGGLALFIEFKRPGGKLSLKQKYWIRILKTLKFEVEVYDNIEKAYEKIKSKLASA